MLAYAWDTFASSNCFWRAEVGNLGVWGVLRNERQKKRMRKALAKSFCLLLPYGQMKKGT